MSFDKNDRLIKCQKSSPEKTREIFESDITEFEGYKEGILKETFGNILEAISRYRKAPQQRTAAPPGP